jgi:hypothetical protein
LLAPACDGQADLLCLADACQRWQSQPSDGR